jgi:NAD(P)-dependent dehydrogenase (short-subunit alcohol dehydrogenase family)
MPLAPTDFRLDDRIVVVTGAAKGIGAAIASAAAAFGADVALCDRDEAGLRVVADEVVRLGRRVHFGVLDVREPAAVRGFAEAVRSAFGRIDALVNNAGGGFAASFLEVSDKGQDALVRENFTSVTSMVRAFVPLLPGAGGERAGGGSVVNITSIEAHRAGPGFAVYSAMKAAVANLTMSLALELGARHIRVNCIAPDVIPTPGVGELPVKTPLPYAGRVDDVSAAAVYLMSDAAAFVTGTTLHVDGGNRAAGGWRREEGGSFTT